MPEITIIYIALLAAALIVGLVVGWVFRSRQSDTEKMAINAGWQEQLEAQRTEHDRLVDQNRMLMEQNSQYQASNKDAKLRAAELSAALKEAFERRDELQRQIKDIRGNLETAVEVRNQLQSEVANRDAEVDVTSVALKQRDDRIAQLNKELASWQERVPPLVERFRVRNEEAQQLGEELAAAQDRIAALETRVGSEQTRVEPVDRSALGDDLYASNESLVAAADDAAADADDPAVGDDDTAGRDRDPDAVAAEIEAGEPDAAPELVEEQLGAQAGDNSDPGAAIDAVQEAVAEAHSADTTGAAGLPDEVSDDNAAAWHASAEQENEDLEDENLEDDDVAASEDFDSGDAADNDSWGADDGFDTDSAASASIYSFTATANTHERDNLKLIKGIGPAIEKTLNEMGIWRFHQIAEMSEYEIDRVARRLKGFRSRIYREDWIGQARDLDQRKTADQH